MCVYMHAWMLLELVILSVSTHAQTCPRPVPRVTQPSSNFHVPRQELGRRLIMTWCVCRSSGTKGKRVPWLEDMLKLEIKTNTTDSEREPPVALTFKWKVRSKDVGKNRPPPPPHDTLPLNMHLYMCESVRPPVWLLPLSLIYLWLNKLPFCMSVCQSDNRSGRV